ncbi:MAG: c-type cytochrome [Betaproteobacteria bacterium]|nr:c-type cytochrome [Betaproteobacteria bacterium]
MKTFIAATVGAALCMGITASSVAANHAEDLATHTCSLCHGPKGESTSPAFPRLAGQNAAYIEAQLKAFREHTRGDPPAQAFMWGMTALLDDQTIHDLAQYYAAQKPVPGTAGDPALMAEGKQIFEHGIPDKKIMACVTCHLPDAQGNETIPRLAGQHADYIVKQLAYFKSEIRRDNPTMHAAIGGNMTLDEMRAIAAYVESK